MGNAALYILVIEFLVKGQGLVKIVYQLVCFLGKTSTP